MQNGGMKVVTVCCSLGGLITPIVALAIGCTGFDACSGHPGHKGASVMVAAIAALREWSASKFGCPDQQGILKQASFFQVFDKRRNWLVDAGCDRREFRGD